MVRPPAGRTGSETAFALCFHCLSRSRHCLCLLVCFHSGLSGSKHRLCLAGAQVADGRVHAVHDPIGALWPLRTQHCRRGTLTPPAPPKTIQSNPSIVQNPHHTTLPPKQQLFATSRSSVRRRVLGAAAPAAAAGRGRRPGESCSKPEPSHGLQLQPLWTDPTAAVSGELVVSRAASRSRGMAYSCNPVEQSLLQL